VAAVTAATVLDDLEDCIRRRLCGQYVVTLNVDILLTALEDPLLLEACRAARWVVADGMPLVWASRLLGRPLPERINGADLAFSLMERAAARGYRVFLLGGEPGVAALASQRLKNRLPGLSIVGTLSPPFGFERYPGEVARTVESVRSACPDIVLAGLGAPKQELWLQRHLKAAGVPVGIGVGGTFNFWSGRVRRAPAAFQRAGLEWLWRLSQEPRRLWKRYLVRDLKFFPLLARELWRRSRAD
jgi:N-acetylglucosaminyldiphosphoundecaprenol N-acetyl-beta-D-mannosaminyltransferase